MHSSHDIDASWDTALQLVQRSLNPNSSLIRLNRISWDSPVSHNEFAVTLGVTGLATTPIIRAAQQFDPSIDTLGRALTQIGPRAASLATSIYFFSQEILHGPQTDRIWIPLLRHLMNHIEVGYHIGISSDAIGPDLGMLIGFSQAIGTTLLISSHARSLENPRNFIAHKATSVDFFELFGCEPHQVSSLVLQRLGFGPERASCAAVALGKSLENGVASVPEIRPWRTAADWITAFLSGQRAPNNVLSLQSIPELAPQTDGQELAVHLAILYEQVDEIRTNNSAWCWHLPGNSYQETSDLIDTRSSTNAAA
jgi:hypothetical protein